MRESSSRLAKSDEKIIHTKVDVLQFESPGPDSKKPGRKKSASKP